MKKFLQIALILFLVNFGIQADARVVKTSDLAKIIEQQQIHDLRIIGYKEVEAKVVHIPIPTINLEEGYITVKINSNSPTILARQYKKIDIYTNGKYERSMGVPLDIKIYDTVLVARNQIASNSILSANNVEFKRMDILSSPKKMLNESALKKDIITIRPVQAGDVIDGRFCKIKPDVVRNAMVKVIFKTDDDMSILVEGRALVEGNIGDSISVENKTYKKVYVGKIIGINQVLVEI